MTSNTASTPRLILGVADASGSHLFFDGESEPEIVIDGTQVRFVEGGAEVGSISIGSPKALVLFADLGAGPESQGE